MAIVDKREMKDGELPSARAFDSNFERRDWAARDDAATDADREERLRRAKAIARGERPEPASEPPADDGDGTPS